MTDIPIPDSVTVEIPTPVAADVAIVVGTILRRAENEQLQPTWTAEQARSFRAMTEFGTLLAGAIVRTLREAGIPDEVILQSGLIDVEPTGSTDTTDQTVEEDLPDAAA